MNWLRPRRLAAVSFLAAATLAVAGCTAGADTGGGGGSSQPAPSITDKTPVTITMWSPWTGRELKQFNEIFKGFNAKYPWITVDSKGGIPDDKLIAGINSGKPPDIAISFGVDNIGKYCQTGAWQDLTPWINGGDGIDLKSVFPPSALTFTSYNDKQCSLPFLTDAFGIYTNDDQLKAAGITASPKSLSELQADAKQLTKFGPNGEITTAGFVPWFTYYCCAMTGVNMGNMFGAKWYDSNGKSAFASDPQWAKIFTWQRQFVADVYGNGDAAAGAAKLKKFIAGSGDEWGCSQDFVKGRVAITIDGEWRNAYMKDCPVTFAYSTAAWPVPDATPDRYGSGSAGGTVVGIPKGAAHADAAWLLLRFMTTDTPTLVYMANNINNVPTTLDSAKSPDLKLPAQFMPFLSIYANPMSSWRPNTGIGDTDESVLGKLMDRWDNMSIQDGDLQAELAKIARKKTRTQVHLLRSLRRVIALLRK